MRPSNKPAISNTIAFGGRKIMFVNPAVTTEKQRAAGGSKI
jgi:hypothetical protein